MTITGKDADLIIVDDVAITGDLNREAVLLWYNEMMPPRLQATHIQRQLDGTMLVTLKEPLLKEGTWTITATSSQRT